MEAAEPAIEGYSGLRLIGRGGFSEVYTAHQERFARTVAVKVITAELSDSGQRRFRREQAAAGQLDGHPHIIRVYESGFTAAGQPYLTMEHHPQGSLSARVHQQGPMPLAEVLSTGVKLACALDAAHRRGIVHRDVKPQNVLISPFVGPVLADFGIAALDDGRTSTLTNEAFSALHVAPEVLDGHRATTSSDLYSLASTLYELLTGHAPYADGDDPGLLALMRRIRTQPVAPVVGEGITPLVNTVLIGLLAQDPGDRPPTALRLAEQLRSLERELKLEPTELVPDTLPKLAEGTSARPHIQPTPAPSWTRSGDDEGEESPDAGSVPPTADDELATDPRRRTGRAASSPTPIGPAAEAPGAAVEVMEDEGELTHTVTRAPVAPRPEPMLAEATASRRWWVWGLVAGSVLAIAAAGGGFLLLQDDDPATAPPLRPEDPAPEGQVPPCPEPAPNELTGEEFGTGVPPSSLEVEATGDGETAEVRWDDPNQGTNFYLVYAYCDAPESDNRVAVAVTRPGAPPRATVEGLSLDFDYCFTVAVLQPNGEADMHSADDGTSFACLDGERW